MNASGEIDDGSKALAELLSFQSLLSLESLAQRAQALTLRRFGRTISLYVPLYLSNFCSSGCAYCGFAADRKTPRKRLTFEETQNELSALKQMGFDEVLLLTGERTPQADCDYLASCVKLAAKVFHRVTIEAFPMSVEEYKALVQAGCTGVTLYQETYDRAQYDQLHRWGPKKDYDARLEAPERALEAGMRTVGLGVLLGLSDPVAEALALFRHVRQLERKFWRAGFSLSFPRIRPQAGGFQPLFEVDDRLLARLIFAFRICLPDVELVLSTRERASFRDGMAGLGITKMSIASRTTVGGYQAGAAMEGSGQFEVSDERSVEEFCRALRSRRYEPVFKNWDAVYREVEAQKVEVCPCD
ncbi:MAG TPA: 2-iminoacetate synthase ThiH [Verrucomicrobia bacterium]|nr:MAG: thiamine biosynthesis protein ThiH [Lentisphaerae bacterium GWF2_57_35]HBA85155.1 2-iminoacetate synthase ThiH [Verrucomicrobiota bacterium]